MSKHGDLFHRKRQNNTYCLSRLDDDSPCFLTGVEDLSLEGEDLLGLSSRFDRSSVEKEQNGN